MTTLEILTIPDTRLKHKSTIVESFDQNLKNTINDMFETLHASGCLLYTSDAADE